MTEPYTPELRAALAQLVTANHILDHLGLADAFGHAAVRSPADPASFFMTGRAAPAGMRAEHDIAHYRVADAAPVLAGDAYSRGFGSSSTGIGGGGEGSSSGGDASAGARAGVASPDDPQGPAAVFRRFPGVRAVVHARSRELVVAGVSGVPVRPMLALAAFLGAHVPVLDDEGHVERAVNGRVAADNASGDGDEKRQQQRQQQQHNHLHLDYGRGIGDRLAAALAADDSMGVSSDGEEARRLPDYAVVLQRGHGLTAWGESMAEAVFRAYYTHENVRVQIAATDHSVVSLGEVKTVPLTERELRDSASMIRSCAFRAWAYWSKVVSAQAMYKNDLLDANASHTAQKFWRTTQHNRMMPF